MPITYLRPFIRNIKALKNLKKPRINFNLKKQNPDGSSPSGLRNP